MVGFYGSEKHLFELKNLSETGAALISKNAISEIAFTRMNFKVSRRSRVLDLDAIPIRIEPLGEQRVMLAVQFLDPGEDVARQLKDFVEGRATGSSRTRRLKKRSR